MVLPLPTSPWINRSIGVLCSRSSSTSVVTRLCADVSSKPRRFNRTRPSCCERGNASVRSVARSRCRRFSTMMLLISSSSTTRLRASDSAVCVVPVGGLCSSLSADLRSVASSRRKPFVDVRRCPLFQRGECLLHETREARLSQTFGGRINRRQPRLRRIGFRGKRLVLRMHHLESVGAGAHFAETTHVHAWSKRPRVAAR